MIAIAHADQAGSGMDILDAWATELKKYADGLGYNVIDICGSDLTNRGLRGERKPPVSTVGIANPLGE